MSSKPTFKVQVCTEATGCGQANVPLELLEAYDAQRVAGYVEEEFASAGFLLDEFSRRNVLGQVQIIKARVDAAKQESDRHAAGAPCPDRPVWRPEHEDMDPGITEPEDGCP